jgi:glucose/arabinose dehydrogenase
MKRRVFFGIGGVLVLLVVAGFLFKDTIKSWFFAPTQSNIEVGVQTPEDVPDVPFGVFAEGLDTPWSITFLPNGDMLATERLGAVRRIGEDGKTFLVEGVSETSEGGLLGIALDPEFAQNNTVYVYLTATIAGNLQNRVDQYTLENDTLGFEKTILGSIPAASYHNGGAIAFGPDKKLYITTGDAAQSQLAQNTSSLAGKVLRINGDGSIPNDNPFGNAVWSYGHRNPQGITWDGEGRLWSVEHGQSGIDGGSGLDELNIIEKGANYGWPTIRGDQSAAGMRQPVVHSGTAETWAPAGIAYADGALFFAGLRGQSLYQATINEDASVSLKRHFTSKYGRLRAVAVKGKTLYFSTSNKDGRGTPSATDDRIFQAPLSLFK